MNKVRVFGSETSPDARLARQLLARWRVPYEWVDIDASPEAAKVLQKLSGGHAPAVVKGDSVLVAPSLRELEALLKIRPRLKVE